MGVRVAGDQHREGQRVHLTCVTLPGTTAHQSSILFQVVLNAYEHVTSAAARSSQQLGCGGCTFPCKQSQTANTASGRPRKKHGYNFEIDVSERERDKRELEKRWTVPSRCRALRCQSFCSFLFSAHGWQPGRVEVTCGWRLCCVISWGGAQSHDSPRGSTQ
jgi:hypothetical protein